MRNLQRCVVASTDDMAASAELVAYVAPPLLSWWWSWWWRGWGEWHRFAGKRRCVCGACALRCVGYGVVVVVGGVCVRVSVLCGFMMPVLVRFLHALPST